MTDKLRITAAGRNIDGAHTGQFDAAGSYASEPADYLRIDEPDSGFDTAKGVLDIVVPAKLGAVWVTLTPKQAENIAIALIRAASRVAAKTNA